MPITQLSLASSANSNILDAWPWEITDAMRPIIKAYADAFGSGFFAALSGLVLAGGTVSGGAAPPSGPVVGAVLSYAPGSATAPAIGLDSLFVFPEVAIPAQGKPEITLRGEYTPWLKKFTATLSQQVDLSWSQYLSTWACAGAAGVVGGGAANWIASTPPAPGPWVAGTITSPFVFDSPATGSSVYLLSSLLEQEFDALGRVSSVTIPIQASDPITVPIINTEHGELFARAFSSGLAKTIADTMTSVYVYDSTGSAASGIAAPGGIVTGTLATATLNLAM